MDGASRGAMRSAVYGLQRRITRSKFAADLVRLEASHGAHFDAVHMSTFWQRMGRIARTHPQTGEWASANAELLATSRARTLQMLPAMEPRAVVGIAHGIASLSVESGPPWDEVWAPVADALLGHVDALNTQDLSNTAWALSRAKYGATPLYDAIASRLEVAAAAGDDGPLMPQAIANSLWAFSAAGVSAPSLYDALAAFATPRLADFKAKELSQLAWAYAKADHAAPHLFDGIAVAAQAKLDFFSPQGIANTTWAFATAGRKAPALFDALADAATPRLQSFGPQELVNLAWAYASALHAAPDLFSKVRAREHRYERWKDQELASMAWSFARLGVEATDLYDAIGRELATRLPALGPQPLSTAAWAFAAANEPCGALFGSRAFGARCAEMTWDNIRQLRQMHQWELWRTERRFDWPEPSGPLRAAFRAAFEAAPEAAPLGASSFEGAVCAAAEAASGVAPTRRAQTAEGYTVDVHLALPGGEIAIEADGPSHFVHVSADDGAPLPSGATALKRRQLRHFGHRLVSIPISEWVALGDDAAAQTEYVRRAMRAVGFRPETGEVVDAPPEPIASPAERAAKRAPPLEHVEAEAC